MLVFKNLAILMTLYYPQKMILTEVLSPPHAQNVVPHTLVLQCSCTFVDELFLSCHHSGTSPFCIWLPVIPFCVN